MLKNNCGRKLSIGLAVGQVVVGRIVGIVVVVAVKSGGINGTEGAKS